MNTLIALLRGLSARLGDRTALAMRGATGVTRLNYTALYEEVCRVAEGLRRLGLRRGDAIALWLPNMPEWITLEFAATALGCAVVAVNTRYRAEELTSILTVSRARCVALLPCFMGIDLRGILGQVQERLPHVDLLLELPEAYDHLRSGTAADHSALDAGPRDVANVFPTSGTTAAPKLAAHAHARIIRHAQNVARGFEIGPGDVMLCSLPFCGVFGFTSVMSALAAGATCVIQTTFDPAEAVELMVEHRVTHFNGTDAMLQALLDVPGFDSARIRHLRSGGLAGFAGRLAETLRLLEHRVEARLGGTYGSSELFALMSRWPAGEPPEVRARGGGRLVSDEIEVRAVDLDDGRVLGHNTPGELQFRGYNLMVGYLGNPTATQEAVTPDGWFRTGDLGYTLDAKSFVYLARAKDSLRLSGFLVDPHEVEEVLARHPSVEGAQVVGVTEPGIGDVPVAFVKLRSEVTCRAQDLIDYCLYRIAKYKVPRYVFFLDEFPTMPSPNGAKIQKAKLRHMAAERLASASVSPAADH